MTGIVVVVALIIVVPVAWIVWRTIGRSMLKLSATVTDIPVAPGPPPADESVAVLEDVRVCEIVRWNDDLLVRLSGDNDEQIRFARGAIEPRTSRLLDRWRSDQQPLVATLGQNSRFALSDRSTGEAILGERIRLKP